MSSPEKWPCTCGHLAEQHGYAELGDLATACLVLSSGKVDNIPDKLNDPYVDDCNKFKLMSNLEYLEMKYASSIS